MKPQHIKVEFDLNYSGGEYNGVGDTVLIPFENIAWDENECNVEAAFEKQTGHSRIHIIYYTLDEIYDANWNGV